MTLAFNEETKNHKLHSERDRQNTRGCMFEDPGNPLCPVASFEKYISKLPQQPKGFYVHPLKNVSDDVWYSREPMGINYLASMMSRICKEAGTSIIYTNHCIRSTTIQKLSESGLEAREIMSVSGHKSEASLSSYWAPSLEKRKRWSNMLSNSASGDSSPASSSTSSATSSSTSSPKRPRLMDTFNNCAFNGTVNVNVYNK